MGHLKNCSTMGMEYRNGRPYYYRKRRKGNKVISEYIGSGELAKIIAALDEEEKYEMENKKQAQLKEKANNEELDAQLVQFEKIIDELFTSLALANGYHKPKRQWRKKRQK